MFVPQTGSSPVPLALPRRVPLKCNIRLQVAQTHSKRLLNAQGQLQDTSMLNHTRKRLLCSITQERDFYAQSQKKETPLLNHTRKRLLCSITKARDFFKQLQRIEKVLNT